MGVGVLFEYALLEDREGIWIVAWDAEATLGSAVVLRAALSGCWSCSYVTDGGRR